jgi:Ca2+-binding RTX toxin-like protein
LVLTAGASAKVSGDMGAGNDNLRVSTIASGYTVAGGDGTDTITYGGTATVAATATANLSTFETVTLTAAPASFSLVASTVNYTTVAPTASTYVGLASGGTLALPLGGTTTLTNTLWTTPTTDTMSVTVGASTTSGALTAAITTTGMETVSIANSSVGTDTTSQRTVGVTDALLKSLTVTGNQPTALTGGGAALTTVNASGVTGNVTMAGLALSTTTASTITGGDGNDTLTAATASLADSIVGGAGNDTITGAQGADTLTGGTGNDTFTIALNSATVGVAQQSGATLMDTITDFTSGADKLNLTQATSFLGNYANLTSGLAATAGSGVGANQAFYSLADNIVYVIATAGTLAATDTMVKLSNAPATLAAGDLNFGSGGNTITLAAPASTVAAGTLTTNTSTYNDIINTTAANMVGSSIDGGVGSGDTLNITDAAPALIFVLNGAGNSINNIEVINLNLGSTGSVAIPTLTTQSLVVNNAHASNPSTVALGAQTAQIAPLITGTKSFVSVSTGIDTVTAGATAQSISTGGGDDVVNVGSQAIFFGGTYNGGAGTNDVLNVTVGATEPISFAAAAVAGGAAVATGFEVINVTIGNAASTVTIVPDAAVAVNFIGDFDANLTVTGTVGAVTANGDPANVININGTGNVTVGGTNTTGLITFTADKTAGTNSVTSYAGAQNVTNSSAIVVTVNGALAAGNTQTYAGSGPITVNGLVGTGTIAAAAATGVITVNGTTAGARTVNTGSAADVITIIGTAATIQTITTLAGNDIVTLSLTGGANVVDLGAGNDTYLAGAAGGSVTGGTGSDSMTGGTGADVFIYSALDSSGANTDTITGLNFNADFIRVNTTLLGTSFDASTATTTAIGYSNFNATSGAITVQTTEGTLNINTATSTNAPSSTGSLQTSAAIQYNIIGSNGADTIVTGSGADTITGGIGSDTMTGGAGADSFVISIIGSGTAVIDRIMDFVGGTDSLNLPVAGTGTINVGSTGADVSIATTLATSTGTSEANLLTDLNIAATARQGASTGLYAQTGDTFQVLITGVSLLGTNVTYVVQEVGGIATTVTTDDIVIGLVGTSTGNISVLTIT